VRDAVVFSDERKTSNSGKRRLAVAGFGENKIAVFDVSIAASTPAKNIALTGVAEISSSHLNQPHGVDFIDDETIVVANRYGQPCVSGCRSGQRDATS
jgi:hypothetical protein